MEDKGLSDNLLEEKRRKKKIDFVEDIISSKQEEYQLTQDGLEDKELSDNLLEEKRRKKKIDFIEDIISSIQNGSQNKYAVRYTVGDKSRENGQCIRQR